MNRFVRQDFPPGLLEFGTLRRPGMFESFSYRPGMVDKWRSDVSL
jgi:hypothetical protein